ncbi:hypothetical protein [Actinomadura miaoliensis]|uniref:FCS-type domain-containing protein n=1 Tax=Actinomadura miaoliensis TaxID=430685 RepID=A0ABP7UVK4_9ACTN
MAACAVCGGPVPVKRRGRPSVYCSRACQAKAYRARKAEGAPMSEWEAARLAAWHTVVAIDAALADGRVVLGRYGSDRPASRRPWATCVPNWSAGREQALSPLYDAR